MAVSYETLAALVVALELQQEKDWQFNKAMCALDQDNMWFGGICAELNHAYQNLLIEVLGEAKYEDLMYWLYDCAVPGSTRNCVLEINGVEHKPQNFEEYYNLIMKDKQ